MNFSCFQQNQDPNAGQDGPLYNPYACLNHNAWDFNSFAYDGARYYYRSVYETTWGSAGQQVTYEDVQETEYYFGQEWFDDPMVDPVDAVQEPVNHQAGVQRGQSWRSNAGQKADQIWGLHAGQTGCRYFQEDGPIVIPHYSEFRAELAAFLSEP